MATKVNIKVDSTGEWDEGSFTGRDGSNISTYSTEVTGTFTGPKGPKEGTSKVTVFSPKLRDEVIAGAVVVGSPRKDEDSGEWYYNITKGDNPSLVPPSADYTAKSSGNGNQLYTREGLEHLAQHALCNSKMWLKAIGIEDSEQIVAFSQSMMNHYTRYGHQVTGESEVGREDLPF
jgi:hypothetical protein